MQTGELYRKNHVEEILMQKLPTPTLKAEVIFLEPIGPQHVSDEYVGWLNDPEINKFLDVRFSVPQSRETVRRYVDSFHANTENYGWVIKACASAAMIGTITIPRVDRVHLAGGIGLMVGDKRYWGTRAAREAFDLVVEFAFDTLGLRRLVEHNVALNHQSNFMLRHAGFRHEGTLKKAYRLAPGADTFVDGFDFALLVDEWRSRRSKREQM
jgi:ribosomal-protein-alanine N-acetyltransferase